MRRALLLYNPSSGTNVASRRQQVEAAARVLQSARIETELLATTGPGSATLQTRDHMRDFDTILACGGDGTMHEILQALAGSEVTLGVVPLGTGNVLANDLRLPRDSRRAAEMLLQFEPRDLATGSIRYRDRRTGESSSRYFLTVAGSGGDALLMYRVAARLKNRGGMRAYYAEMARIALTHRFVPFELEYRDESGKLKTVQAVQAAGVRITTFGGLMQRWAPGAQLDRNDMRLVIFRDANRLRFSAYSGMRMLNLPWNIPGVDLVSTTYFRCRAIGGDERVYVEGDGEVISTLPAEVTIAEERVRLLMPPR